MRTKKYIITGPYPTVEEVAATLGVSKARLKRLREIMAAEPPKPAAKKAARKTPPKSAKGNGSKGR